MFAVLLLACCGASAWLQIRSNEWHEQEVVQRLSRNLAGHIAGNTTLMEAGGLNQQAVHELFGKLMDVNPSVEVYLLGLDGVVQAQAAPPGHLKRDRVDVAPIRRLIAGESEPVFGDDPRSESGRKVFSAAPLRVAGRDAGYVYVVLLGEDRDAVARHLSRDSALRTTLWLMALVAGLGLLAGLAAFHWITRPLRELTSDVSRFEAGGMAAGEHPATSAAGSGDEIATLRLAFSQMTQRIAEQWRELTSQDQQRRELVANISHDLRTPLTSLHGYLETLRMKSDSLSEVERVRYLDIALGQSRKVGRLAQELFELARLEHGVVKPDKERFSLAELAQDVLQKFELAAQARQQRLMADIAPRLPAIAADLGMIERVLTNLLDNAIRHTPAGGQIELRLRDEDGGVEVQVSDTGPGIPQALQNKLFTRALLGRGARDGPAGGLGLLIVQRMLQLHDSEIKLVSLADRGAVFSFRLREEHQPADQLPRARQRPHRGRAHRHALAGPDAIRLCLQSAQSPAGHRGRYEQRVVVSLQGVRPRAATGGERGGCGHPGSSLLDRDHAAWPPCLCGQHGQQHGQQLPHRAQRRDRTDRGGRGADRKRLRACRFRDLDGRAIPVCAQRRDFDDRGVPDRGRRQPQRAGGRQRPAARRRRVGGELRRATAPRISVRSSIRSTTRSVSVMSSVTSG